ncbi:MAG: hypothetical protein PVI13_01325 [Desulfobacterales bacterium]
MKFVILIIIAVPAFVGYPVASFEAAIFPGITYGWVIYLLVVHLAILIITGRQFFPNVLTIAVLIAMPVVFVGAGISYLIYLFGWGYPSGPPAYSAHYVSLCITMLTVIPLALSLVAIIPFQDFEQGMLNTASGVSKIEKWLLMFLRVFNHIVFFVIPTIVETMREEAQYKRWADSLMKSSTTGSLTGKIRLLGRRFLVLVKDMTQLGVEGICASIQYIPLWAVEISQLPARTKIINAPETD